MPHKRDWSDPFLFEVSWEVCNQGIVQLIQFNLLLFFLFESFSCMHSFYLLVGGIYTVIKTKAATTVEEYGDRYIMIGPWIEKKSSFEVEVKTPPLEISLVIDQMQSHGIRILYGKWLIEGSPNVLLFDINSARERSDEWKEDFWNHFRIGCRSSDREMNDSIIFGYLVIWFLGEFLSIQENHAVIAHFHEWMGSAALLLSKDRNLEMATIFTTHATILGRYLCAGDCDFYNNLKFFNLDEETGKRGIYDRYCLERAAAHSAMVFTTVSHITAFESEHILKRRPDGVLPNGLNVIKFSAIHEFQNLHAQYKQKIHEFVQGHFFGHYDDVDPENTLYFFISGRYEFRNKGVDLFLESLASMKFSSFLNCVKGKLSQLIFS